MILEQLLQDGAVPDYSVVRSLVDPPEAMPWPRVQIPQPDLTAYDQLIAQ